MTYNINELERDARALLKNTNIIIPGIIIDDLGIDFNGYYKDKKIYLNFKIRNFTPLHVLFHEIGHHIYEKEEIQNIWKKYYDGNIKKINFRKLENFYMHKYQDEPIRYIPPKIKILLDYYYNYLSHNVFMKLESWYADNEEEVFCETFATYFNSGCLYEQNKNLIKNILNVYEEKLI
jgi:Zn-dependent peptidase ImmA (M78 family)